MYIKTSNQEKLELGIGNYSCNWGIHIAGLYETDVERDEIINYDVLVKFGDFTHSHMPCFNLFVKLNVVFLWHFSFATKAPKHKSTQNLKQTISV